MNNEPAFLTSLFFLLKQWLMTKILRKHRNFTLIQKREREQKVGNECLLKMFLALALQVSCSYLMRKQQPYRSWL